MRIYYVPDLDLLCIELHKSPETHHGTRVLAGGVTVDVNHRETPQRIHIDKASTKYPAEVLAEVERWDGK